MGDSPTKPAETPVELRSKMELISRRFLACRPATEIADSIEALLEDFDEDLLVQTVFRNITALTYPPNKAYRLSVLKTLISRLENSVELGDGLYDQLAETVSAEDGKGFVTYVLTEGGTSFAVTLEETRAFVSQGTTGLKSWPAAQILVEILLASGDLAGQKILELGSGVGLSGLCVLKMRPLLNRFTFTDCHEAVLRCLKTNVGINLEGEDDRATVQLLDWSVGGEISACDLLVGADIVFDRDIIKPLVSLISGALREQRAKQAIIASVIRNPATYSAFRDAIEVDCDIETIAIERFKYFDEVTDAFEVIRIKRR